MEWQHRISRAGIDEVTELRTGPDSEHSQTSRRTYFGSQTLQPTRLHGSEFRFSTETLTRWDCGVCLEGGRRSAVRDGISAIHRPGSRYGREVDVRLEAKARRRL